MSEATPTSASAGTAGTTSGDDGRRPIRRALLSVYDKTGLVELAQALTAAGVAVVSTGSTAATMAAAGVPVTPVEDLTGFPETLDGRVKTLHPKVHAGLLADQNNPSHVASLAELGIESFDLLVSNLYPFTDTVASGAGPDECIEQIDIGGPAMVRASAKNHASMAVVTSPSQYPALLAAVAGGGFSLAARQRLAAEAFVHTATYDVNVASWLGNVVADTSDGSGFPAWAGATWNRKAVLRYGENPHQRAAVYESGYVPVPGLAQAVQLHGKEMSYNNYVDADSARRTALGFADPTVAIIKHANPCGIATIVGGDDAAIALAHERAHACDPVSAYGGVIATNRPVTAALATQIAPIFTEVVVAPSFEPEALAILTKKKNLRLLTVLLTPIGGVETRAISGGMLMQTTDVLDADGDDVANWKLVSGPALSTAALDDLLFAWRACRAVKSNAILLAHDGATVGVGMGQVNRVDSAKLAVARAGDRAAGSVAASDAFFPFADGLEVLLAAGVSAVAQPGGSIRDEEVIAAAETAGVTMYLTGARHFFH